MRRPLTRKDHALPILNGRDRPIASVQPPDLASAIAQHGYLLLRGFRVDLHAFSLFVKQHSSRLSLDPARAFHDASGQPVAQKVDAGLHPVGLHCENGNSPFWPDLCWFFCQNAPAIGSQTTVCDGIAAFNELPQRAQQAFSQQDILYTRRVHKNHWQTYARIASPENANPTLDTHALFQQLRALANDSANTQLQLLPDESIHYRFQTPAVLSQSPFLGQFRAFANSIFGPSFNYEQPVISFADGSPIPQPLLDEAKRACNLHTLDIHWRDRDVVVIDNRRVMHGRRAIQDPGRVIFNALSYA